MKELTSTFGLTVAFLLPGSVGLWGISRFLEPLRSWVDQAQTPQSGASLIVLLLVAALATGVTLSGIRHTVVVLIRTRSPSSQRLNYAKLAEDETALNAFVMLNESLFRFHLFFGNMSLAIAIAYVGLIEQGTTVFHPGNFSMFVVLEFFLLFASVDMWFAYRDHAAEVLTRGEV